MDNLIHLFQNIDYGALLAIIGIDIMLGVDNAIVIALACATLPVAMRSKAIMFGTAGAVGLRAILLVAASLLMNIPFLKLVAGAYLIYIGYKLLAANEEEHNVAGADNIMGAIKTIIVADFMMSLDNVLAVTSAAQSAGEHSTTYAIVGILLSIPVIVWGAQGIIKLMEKFPAIIWVGGGLLGWVGAEMMISDGMLPKVLGYANMTLPHEAHLPVKIAGFAAVIGAVLVHKYFQKRKETVAA